MKSVGKVFAKDLNKEIDVYAKTGESVKDAMARVEKAHMKGRPPGPGSFSISKGHLSKKENSNEKEK